MFSNDEMNDMIKIAKSLEDSDVLMKDVSETLKKIYKERRSFTNFTNVVRNLGIIFNW